MPILVRLLFLSVCLMSGLAFAGTLVSSNNKGDLEKLRKSLKAMTGNECDAIKDDKLGFTVDILKCVPAGVRSLISAEPKMAGPNCFNFANIIVGVQDFTRYVSAGEVAVFINPHSGYCKKLKRTPKTGDYAIISEGDHQIHAYVYLTDMFAFSKNGPDKENSWGISDLKTINDLYKTSGPNGKTPIVNYYECSLQDRGFKKPLSDVASLNSQFARSVGELAITSPATDKMNTKIKADFEALKKSMTPEVEKELKSKKGKAKELLLSIYGHLHTFESASGQKPAFDSIRTEYLDFASDLMEKTDSVNLPTSDLISGESSMLYEYCSTRDSKPAICRRE